MIEGPDLFYPTPGKVAVMGTGSRIVIWPWEDNDADTFSGQMLLANRSGAQIAVHDVSCMWDRKQITAIEDPTDADRQLSIYDL